MSNIIKPPPESSASPGPMRYTTEVVQQTRVQLILHTYQDILHRLLRSPAVWVFSGIWVLSVLTLALTGYLEYMLGAVGCLGIALFIGLVSVALTAHAPAQAPSTEQTQAPTFGRKWLWAQLAVLLIFLIFTGFRVVIGNYPAATWLAQLPLVGPLAVFTLKLPFLAGNSALNALLHPLTPNPQLAVTYILMNLTLYVVFPLLALLLLRARLSELGFGRGYRSWTVLAVVCFLPIVALLVNLASGPGTLGILSISFVYNLLVAGFPEEVFFRGALLTRLSRLWGSEWGVVLSTLVFGLWHFGLTMRNTNGNILAAIALSIALQGMIGLWFAILFVRTRNLLAPVVVHTLWNVLGL